MRFPMRPKKTRRWLAALLAIPLAAGVTLTVNQLATADGLGVAKTELTVLNWNIHGSTADIPAMAKVIKNAGADVVTVQEIQRADSDQVKALVDALGWHQSDLGDNVHFSQADHPGPCDAPTSDGWVGNAVLSKYPIKERVTIPLSPKDQNCPVKRVMAGVKLNLPGDDYIRVFTSHFTPGLDSNAIAHRQQQAKAVLNKLSHAGPLLFTGDLNARPGSKVAGWFPKHGWQDTGGDLANGSTHNGHRIDYIFAKHVNVTKGEVIKSTLSDHRPVVMTMTVT